MRVWELAPKYKTICMANAQALAIQMGILPSKWGIGLFIYFAYEFIGN